MVNNSTKHNCLSPQVIQHKKRGSRHMVIANANFGLYDYPTNEYSWHIIAHMFSQSDVLPWRILFTERTIFIYLFCY
jgi:hypothetical protein